MAAPDTQVDAATQERRPTVIVDNVKMRYRVVGAAGGLRSTRSIDALKGVSFIAYEGDAIGLIGRNGSGKSTLLRCIAGLTTPTSGRIYAAGHPQFLGVNAALMRDLTGERNVMLGGLALGMTPKEVRECYDDIVEFAGLDGFMDLPLRTYSSGMAARLRFAISTVKRPEVLLIDEALATGDAEFRKRSEERIKEIRAAAGTIFLVSHSLAAIEHSCNRAIWLDRGVLRMDGSVPEVIEAYRASVPGAKPKPAGTPGPKPGVKPPVKAAATPPVKAAATPPAKPAAQAPQAPPAPPQSPPAPPAPPPAAAEPDGSAVTAPVPPPP